LSDGVHSRAAAYITPEIWFPPSTAAVGEILSLHVHAIEGVGRGAKDHAFDLFEFHLG
jgi:hypothetical protein